MVKKKRQIGPHDDSSSTDSSDDKVLSSSTAAVGGCEHVKKSVDPTKLRKLLKANGIVRECVQCLKVGIGNSIDADDFASSSNFEYDNTLWLCLKCGSQLCGRSKNQHALQHFKTPHSDSHALAMNTRSLEIWCYDCDNEVTASSRKNLVECVEVVKKAVAISNVEQNVQVALATMDPLPNDNESKSLAPLPLPLPPPPPPPLPPIPGMAKRISTLQPPNTLSLKLIPPLKTAPSPPTHNLNAKNAYDSGALPRVRGLTNLGNTCFFNAVMQCLAQTPYLLDVLKESSAPGEEFILPGGIFKFKDDNDVQLPMIKGRLASWGPLTAALAQALEELQSGGGVFSPSRLFDKLTSKCPQFRDGDQHDAHELLRHLLESVRSDDLKRYQRVILENLGYKDQDITTVGEEMRQKCKIYGNQAADRILRPEQVFRGFLVSTLTCQDCFNVSSRHEYFLDMSLPVSVESPRPPQRRRPSPDHATPNSFFLLHNNNESSPTGPTKAQLKKEKEKERKAKRAQKHQNKKVKHQRFLGDSGMADDANTSNAADGDGATSVTVYGCEVRNEAYAGSTSSSSEQSDADVEDNLIDDIATTSRAAASTHIAAGASDSHANDNNKSQLPPHKAGSVGGPEKRGDSPENKNKNSATNNNDDDDDDDENDSGIATSPAIASSFLPSSETNGGASSDAAAKSTTTATITTATTTTTNNSVLAVGLSEKGAILVRQLSLSDAPSLHLNAAAAIDATKMHTKLTEQLDKLNVGGTGEEQHAEANKPRRVRTQSYSDWSTTIAPRYQCEDGECSIQSCLNNFTAVELMTGNNKVGCENCTRRLNGSGSKASNKTVNTNATKQFLISSPPAVLILHLKRFQLGPRCMFRKLTRHVTFQMVLDIAPFCGSKVKNLPNIDRKQKKLLYALYGVVEHSGGMYGGHYTAYVKVRPKLATDDKRWKFIPQGTKSELDQADEQREKLEELLAKEKARELRLRTADDSDDFSSSSSSNNSSTSEDADALPETPNDGAVGGSSGGTVFDEASNVQVPLGKWYYVSDSRVQEVNEDAVLKAQAYLLFYERIY